MQELINELRRLQQRVAELERRVSGPRDGWVWVPATGAGDTAAGVAVRNVSTGDTYPIAT